MPVEIPVYEWRVNGPHGAIPVKTLRAPTSGAEPTDVILAPVGSKVGPGVFTSLALRVPCGGDADEDHILTVSEALAAAKAGRYGLSLAATTKGATTR